MRTINDITIDEGNELMDKPVKTQEELNEAISKLSKQDIAELVFSLPDVDYYKNPNILFIIHYFAKRGEFSIDKYGAYLIASNGEKELQYDLKHYVGSLFGKPDEIMRLVRNERPIPNELFIVDKKKMDDEIEFVLKLFINHWKEIFRKIYTIMSLN